MTITTEKAEECARGQDAIKESSQFPGYRSIAERAGATIRSLAAERDSLQKRVAELQGALKDAAASVKEWGAYASQYFQDKWDLPGEVARYIAVAEGKNDAALGGKDE